MKRKTIARYDVEADARHYHYPGFFSPAIQGSTHFKHTDLAGDVGVMFSIAQTGFDHRLARDREWTSAMKHHIDLIERGIKFLSFIKREDAVFESVLFRKRLYRAF